MKKDLKKTINSNQTNNMTSDQLFNAVMNGNKVELEQLLEAGGDVNAKNSNGQTLLHCAIKPIYSGVNYIQNVNIVQLLLKKSADVNIKDKLGNTPLHDAAYLNDRAMINLLINAGAYIFPANNKGKNIFEYANQRSTDNYVNKLADFFFKAIEKEDIETIETFLRKNKTWLLTFIVYDSWDGKCSEYITLEYALNKKNFVALKSLLNFAAAKEFNASQNKQQEAKMVKEKLKQFIISGRNNSSTQENTQSTKKDDSLAKKLLYAAVKLNNVSMLKQLKIILGDSWKSIDSVQKINHLLLMSVSLKSVDIAELLLCAGADSAILIPDRSALLYNLENPVSNYIREKMEFIINIANECQYVIKVYNQFKEISTINKQSKERLTNYYNKAKSILEKLNISEDKELPISSEKNKPVVILFDQAFNNEGYKKLIKISKEKLDKYNQIKQYRQGREKLLDRLQIAIYQEVTIQKDTAFYSEESIKTIAHLLKQLKEYGVKEDNIAGDNNAIMNNTVKHFFKNVADLMNLKEKKPSIVVPYIDTLTEAENFLMAKIIAKHLQEFETYIGMATDLLVMYIKGEIKFEQYAVLTPYLASNKVIEIDDKKYVHIDRCWLQLPDKEGHVLLRIAVEKQRLGFLESLDHFNDNGLVKVNKQQDDNKQQNNNDQEENNKTLLRSIINKQQYDGKTLLHYAVSTGNIKIVKFLIEKKADINVKARDGKTPFYETVSIVKNKQFINALVKLGAKVNVEDNDGKTPLHYAASFANNTACAVALIKLGARVNAKDKNGITPLRLAAKIRNIELVKYLLKNKNIDINATDYHGNTLLHIAARDDNVEVVKSLLAAGADLLAVNYDGEDVLQYVPNGFHIHDIANSFFDAIACAVMKGKLEIIEQTLENNKTWLFVKNEKLEEKTPLEYAIDICKGDFTSIFLSSKNLANGIKLLECLLNMASNVQSDLLKGRLQELMTSNNNQLLQTVAGVVVKNEESTILEKLKVILNQENIQKLKEMIKSEKQKNVYQLFSNFSNTIFSKIKPKPNLKSNFASNKYDNNSNDDLHPL